MVLAHALRTAYATDADPFAGLLFGFVDEDPATIAFMVGLIEDASDRGLPLDADEISEMADAWVPWATADLWSVAGRLRPFIDEDVVREMCAPDADISDRMRVALFMIAERILWAVAQ